MYAMCLASPELNLEVDLWAVGIKLMYLSLLAAQLGKASDCQYLRALRRSGGMHWPWLEFGALAINICQSYHDIG